MTPRRSRLRDRTLDLRITGSTSSRRRGGPITGVTAASGRAEPPRERLLVCESDVTRHRRRRGHSGPQRRTYASAMDCLPQVVVSEIGRASSPECSKRAQTGPNHVVLPPPSHLTRRTRGRCGSGVIRRAGQREATRPRLVLTRDSERLDPYDVMPVRHCGWVRITAFDGQLSMTDVSAQRAAGRGLSSQPHGRANQRVLSAASRMLRRRVPLGPPRCRRHVRP